MSDDGTSATFLWTVFEKITPGIGEWETRARNSLISQGYTEWDWIPADVIKETFSNLGWRGDLKTDWKELFGTTPWKDKGGVLPGWIKNLKPLATDPVGWFQRHFRKMLLGAIFSFGTAVADVARWPWEGLADVLQSVADKVAMGPDVVGTVMLSGIESLDAVFREVGTALGPVGVFVYLGLWLGFLILWGRAMWAVLDSVPGLTSVQKFLEGFR